MRYHAAMADPVKIDVTTDDGVATCWVYGADAATPRPGLLLYPDAGDVRPSMQELAAEVASYGYVVLMPGIFYRSGDYPPFQMATVFSDPSERARLGKIMAQLDTASAMRDAAHYLRALREQPGVAGDRFGAFGYCIGGRLAFLTATHFPDQIAAVAPIHGGGLVTDKPDSPHAKIADLRASVYLGIADNDQSCSPEAQGTLLSALAAAHRRVTIDHFADCGHGFAVADFAVFNAAAAKTHLARLRELFASAF